MCRTRRLFLAIWVVGGALAFAGAMAYAELATVRPKAGGEYVYLDAAFGRLAAFLTGWTSFVAGFSGAIAAAAVVFASYLGRFVPGAADNAPLVVVPLPLVTLTVSRQTLVALSIIALMAWIHVRGVGPGRLVGNVLAALKVSAIVLFIALGLSMGAGSTVNLRSSAGAVGVTSWLLALVPVMFTYAGWNAATYVAEEIRDPGRNIPRALAMGTVAVIAIYCLLNLLYLYVVPIEGLAAVQGSVLDVIADKLLGVRAGDVMGVVSIISLAATISAMTIAGPRVYYAMARDGVFFAAGGAGAPALPHTRGVDRRASHVERRAGGIRRRGRAHSVYGVCGRALLRRGGGRALRAARARAAHGAVVQRARLPRRTRDLRRRLAAHRRECDGERSARVRHGRPDHPRGRADLHALLEARRTYVPRPFSGPRSRA